MFPNIHSLDMLGILDPSSISRPKHVFCNVPQDSKVEVEMLEFSQLKRLWFFGHSMATGINPGSSAQRRQCHGAAAATALLTATKPLDVDEATQVIQRQVSFPTSFAGPLQHEGGLVQIMAEAEIKKVVSVDMEGLHEVARFQEYLKMLKLKGATFDLQKLLVFWLPVFIESFLCL